MAFLTSSTSYRRLDSAFLSSGEDAKVAEEFERKTGIQRKDFLEMLAGLSENKLYASDPQLAEKVDAQIERFVAKIPDSEFKEKVAKALELVPSLSRHKLLVQAVQNMVTVARGFSSSTSPSGPAPASVPPAQAATQSARAPASAENGDGAVPAKKAAAEEILLDVTGQLNNDEMAKADDSKVESKIDGVVLAALSDDPGAETIFERVSRRYRMLSGEILAPKQKNLGRR